MWSGRKIVTTGLKMNDVFSLMEQTHIITDEIMLMLMEKFGERTVDHIGGMRVHELATEFKLAGIPNHSKVAREILEFMRENEYVSIDTPATTAPQGPIEVKIVHPEDPAKMPLGKLLELLAGDPSRFGEIFPHIETNAQFAAAMAKVGNGKIIALTVDGKIDVTKTVAYIEFLFDPDGQPQTNSYRGNKLTTLAKALGRKASVMFNPLTGEFMKDGLGQFDKDWTTLPETTYRTVLWAMMTGKVEQPKGSDIRRITIELFTSPLPAFWQGLVEEYELAVEDEDPSTVICRLPMDLLAAALKEADKQITSGQMPPAGRNTATPNPELTEDDYRQMLYDHAESRLDVGGSLDRRGGILTSFRVGGSCTLNSTVVLEGGSCGGSARGTVYVRRGFRVHAGGSNHMQVFERSDEELCKIAGLI